MKLSRLIEEAEKAMKEHGDMEVHALVNYDEDCEKCGQSLTHNKEGAVFNAHADITHEEWCFWVRGDER